MKQPAAVLGVGQTRHRSKRTDVSIAGLCREAADRALLDAGLEFRGVAVGSRDIFLCLLQFLRQRGLPALRLRERGPGLGGPR